jgi:peptidoglycan/LPS O-acetylase OafA/YrhL
MHEPKSNRLYEIDLLRFIAALAVTAFHFLYRGYSESDRRCDVEFPAEGVWARYGYLGVALFFVISGFVILMSAEGKSARDFVVSRVTRLYPAYWVAVVVTYLCILLMDDGRFAVSFKNFLANLTMLQGFAFLQDVDGVYWTLTVEMKFYFLILCVAATRQFHRLKWFMAVWLALAAWMLWRGSVKGLNYLFIPKQAPFFIMGMAFYQVWKNGWRWSSALLLAAAYFAGLWHLLESAPAESTFPGRPDHRISPWVVGSVFFGITCVFLAVANRWTTRLGRPWMAALGAMTYPLYLLHQNIGFMLLNILGPRWPKHLVLGVILLFMLLSAHLLATRVEKPLAKLLKRWLTKQ